MLKQSRRRNKVIECHCGIVFSSLCSSPDEITADAHTFGLNTKVPSSTGVSVHLVKQLDYIYLFIFQTDTGMEKEELSFHNHSPAYFSLCSPHLQSLSVLFSPSFFQIPVSLSARWMVSSSVSPSFHFHSFIYNNHLLCVFIVFPALIDDVRLLFLCQ